MKFKKRDVNHSDNNFLSKQRIFYACMLSILIIESFMLIYEKSNAAPDGLQGMYVYEDSEHGGPIEYVYQYPPISNLDASSGVMILAHGCSHSALDFWPKFDLTCPKCKGLPIEKSIVLESLSRDYIVVAISSLDTKTRCWDTSSKSLDLKRVEHAIENIRNKINLPTNIPNFIIGASSGGMFASPLAIHLNEQAKGKIADTGTKITPRPHLEVTAINVQISTIPRSLWKRTYIDETLLPSIHFVHMSRDNRLKNNILDFLEKSSLYDNTIIIDNEKLKLESIDYNHDGIPDKGVPIPDNNEDDDNAWYNEYIKQLKQKDGKLKSLSTITIDKWSSSSSQSKLLYKAATTSANAKLLNKVKGSNDNDNDFVNNVIVMMRSMASPIKITPEFLVYRTYGVLPSYRIANHLIDAFKVAGIIDEKTGLLTNDPRAANNNWRDIVMKSIPDAIKHENDNLLPDQSALSEILNVAYAQHEFTDEFLSQTLDFFDELSPFNTDEDW